MNLTKAKFYFSTLMILCLFFQASASLAEGAATTEAQSVAIPCKECSQSTNDIGRHMQEIIKMPIDESKVSDPADKLLIQWLKWKRDDYAKSCQGYFMEKDGSLGPYSKLLISKIGKNVETHGDDSVFLKNNPDFDRVCPAFSTFSVKQKMAFHAWLFESLAFPEASCDPAVKAPGAVSQAACLYQLNYLPKDRYWRGPECAVSGQVILTPEGCTACALRMYESKYSKDGTPFGVFDKITGKKISGSYWASMNALTKEQEACWMKYVDPKTGAPHRTTTVITDPKSKAKKAVGNYDFMSHCPGANIEWTARHKYFLRIQRFPFCNTDITKQDMARFNSYQEAKAKK